jgi:hypothetical protein
MDKKYISRAIPVTQEKLETIEEYRVLLEEALGFKISLSDAVTHAVKNANSMLEEIQILTEELKHERQPKKDER